MSERRVPAEIGFGEQAGGGAYRQTRQEEIIERPALGALGIVRGVEKIHQ
jgi:hypothetical protein